MGKFRTIVADPPWPIPHADRRIGKGGRRARDTTLGYPVMTLEAIAALPVVELAAADAHLYLWVTAAFNRDGTGKRIAESWGFRVVSEIIWEKPNFGMGAFPRPTHEPLLVCRRGKLPFALNNVRSVQRWGVERGPHTGKVHSRKPEGAQDLIERASPGPYVELFARRQRLNWHVWGNEVESTVALATD